MKKYLLLCSALSFAVLWTSNALADKLQCSYCGYYRSDNTIRCECGNDRVVYNSWEEFEENTSYGEEYALEDVEAVEEVVEEIAEEPVEEVEEIAEEPVEEAVEEVVEEELIEEEEAVEEIAEEEVEEIFEEEVEELVEEIAEEIAEEELPEEAVEEIIEEVEEDVELPEEEREELVEEIAEEIAEEEIPEEEPIEEEVELVEEEVDEACEECDVEIPEEERAEFYEWVSLGCYDILGVRQCFEGDGNDFYANEEAEIFCEENDTLCNADLAAFYARQAAWDALPEDACAEVKVGSKTVCLNKRGRVISKEERFAKYNGRMPLLSGKKVYTVKEAEEALKDGTKFHVGLTYK